MSEHAAAPAAAANSLAELLYVELIGRAFLRVENNAVIKPDPAQLAKLAIELASIFDQADRAKKAESGPKNIGYDVTKLDLGNIGN